MKTIEELKTCYRSHLTTFGLKTKDGLLDTALNAAQKEGDYLTQDFIDRWCEKRRTEGANSYNARVGHVRRFLKYCNTIGCSFRLPKLMCFTPYTPPYIPSEEEVRNLLEAADEFADISIRNRAKVSILRHELTALQAPIALRTLISTGMRGIEARELLTKNVDLQNATMRLRGKGYKERVIPIHPSLLGILREYDRKMEQIIPSREYFFCREEGKKRSKHWPGDLFRVLWNQKNEPDKTVVYSLRHLFVIRIINRWEGHVTDEQLYALAAALGHKNIETTIRFYYHWLPNAGKQFNEQNLCYFDLIVPNLAKGQGQK